MAVLYFNNCDASLAQIQELGEHAVITAMSEIYLRAPEAVNDSMYMPGGSRRGRSLIAVAFVPNSALSPSASGMPTMPGASPPATAVSATVPAVAPVGVSPPGGVA